jgi:hypothetical protein
MEGKMLNFREGSGVEGKMKVNGLSLSHTHTQTHTNTQPFKPSLLLFCA